MSEKLGIITGEIERAIAVKQTLLSQAVQIQAIAEALIDVIKGGGTIYSCGNGGSACDAMHFTEELAFRYLRTRPGIKAQHFVDSAGLTCWGNDESFDTVFERQTRTFVGKRDALVVFTTSGNSKNIIAALEAAKASGAVTIGFLGGGGGKSKALVRHPLIIESNETARIQECHITAVHIVCEILETELFPQAK